MYVLKLSILGSSAIFLSFLYRYDNFLKKLSQFKYFLHFYGTLLAQDIHTNLITILKENSLNKL